MVSCKFLSKTHKSCHPGMLYKGELLRKNSNSVIEKWLEELKLIFWKAAPIGVVCKLNVYTSPIIIFGNHRCHFWGRAHFSSLSYCSIIRHFNEYKFWELNMDIIRFKCTNYPMWSETLRGACKRFECTNSFETLFRMYRNWYMYLGM